MSRYSVHVFKTPYMSGQGESPFLYTSYTDPTSEGYRPMSDSIYVSCDVTADEAICAIERLVTRQMELIGRAMRPRACVVDATPKNINVSSMLDVWGRLRRNPACCGVYFWINRVELEIFADAFYL